MVGAAFISQSLEKISAADVQRLKNLLRRLNLVTEVEGCEAEKLFNATFRDKKTVGGKVNWISMKKIGEVEISDEVPEKFVKNALKKILRESFL